MTSLLIALHFPYATGQGACTHYAPRRMERAKTRRCATMALRYPIQRSEGKMDAIEARSHLQLADTRKHF